MTMINGKLGRLRIALLAAAALGSSSAVLSGALAALTPQPQAHFSTLA
jgi:hypothetical protein